MSSSPSRDPTAPASPPTLTGILSQQGATLHDIEQVVVQGQLTLCLLVDVPETRDVLKELLFSAKQLGMELDFKPVATPTARRGRRRRARAAATSSPRSGRRWAPPHLHAIASTLAAEGANIEKIGRLSENTLASVEIHALLPPGRDSDALKRTLLSVATSAGFDVSLQRESLYRRSKRLVVLDMDSTLIRIEVIDELARAAGVGAEVSRITERAMQGEMDYDESLRQRVGLLAGLDVAVLDQLAPNLPLTDGAETLVRVLKRLGYKIAVISGGFSRAAEALKRRLGVDYAYSNNLEVQGGKLTGRVVGPIVNAQRKAELLETIAQAEGVLLDQVIAVGDGANDALMLERAGLGIAFHAKPKLREAADTSISAAGLDAILYLLGILRAGAARGGVRAAGTLALAGLAAVLFAAPQPRSASGERRRRRIPVCTCPGCAATAPASARTRPRSKRRCPSAWATTRSRARRPSSSRRSSPRSRPASRSRIAMRGADGKLLGNRALTSSPGDCRSIATAAALTIAILIDPDALARAPAPKPPPSAPTPQRRRRRRAFPRGA